MASYLAIARKWRPHRFEDLVGQLHVVQTLQNSILLERVSHAYLFSGSRGIGKTSVARIFAKALRCPNAKNGLPCNDCPECLAISESRSVDVVEIDGASNNGVEAVRGIRENVAYGASSGTYKIYIIDEVHMLSISAFNALLKTLEEPPPHVVFIFATTEVQKIPLTILSRCQRFEFRRLTNAQVVERLQHILKTEKLAFSEEALRTIAAHSDGSLRDALSLLDQVLSFYGNRSETEELTNPQVVEALGVSDSSTIRSFLNAIFDRDVDGILKVVGDTYFAGVDLKHFTERTLEELRYIYLLTVGSKSDRNSINAETLDISHNHFQTLLEMSKKASLPQLERMAQILSKTVEQLGWATMPRFVLEMAGVRMGRLGDLEKIEAAFLAQSQSRVLAATAEMRPAFAQPAQTHSTTSGNAGPATSDTAPPSEMPNWSPPAAPAAPATYSEGSNPQQAWKVFVDAVMKRRPLLGALLAHANFKMETAGTEKTIILAYPPNSFYERQGADPKNKAELEEQIRNFFGRDSKLVLSSDLGDTMRSLEETRSVNEAVIKKSAIEHPEVEKMKKILGAEVVGVNIKEQP